MKSLRSIINRFSLTNLNHKELGGISYIREKDTSRNFWIGIIPPNKTSKESYFTMESDVDGPTQEQVA